MKPHATRPESREEPGGHGSTDRDDAPADPVLSVVIVTYNEADRVEPCIESVLRACRQGPAFEVVLVDSNSTDGTVDAAREYPVTVLGIPSDDLTTPAAGRFVGTDAVDGDYVLFVDGDVELTDGWLPRALEWVRGYDDVAGVDGHLNESDAQAVQSVSMLHGVALYDATALAAVGGFDPFLQALEDVELGARLRDRGYRLLRLPDVVAHHPKSPETTEVLRRWRNGYYLGLGQVVRKSATAPRILSRLLARYRYPLAFQGWLVAGAGAAVAGAWPLLAWLVLSVGLFAADVAWEGRDRAIYRCSEYALMTVGFVRGLVLGSRDPDTYPLGTTVRIEDPGVQSGTVDDRARERQVVPAEETESATHTEAEPT